MRVAVISDIHGNLHALEAVLRALDRDAPDELWCLGDLVGYGPRPNDCCALVCERAAFSLIGNHDLAVLGRLDLGDFSSAAAESAEWTASVLSDGSRRYLESLEPSGEREEVGLYHGSPRDRVWEYVLSREAALASLRAASQWLVLVGHSHVPLAFAHGDDTLDLAPGGTEVELEENRWLLNPGSVGQPRDGDFRAAYLLLELEVRRALFRRVPYPVARTQQEIRERRLPEALAARLDHGL